jgi:hypothetical protein
VLKQVARLLARRNVVKRAIILLAAIVAGSATASAQDSAAFGVKGGVNFTSAATDDPLVDTSYRPGFLIGALAWLPATDRVAFQPEFLYSKKRTQFTVEGIDATLTGDYIEFPLLMDVRLNNSPSRFSLVVGPSVSVRTRARLNVAGESIDASEQIDRIDFSLVTGLAFTTGRFVLDGRYIWGLIDVASADDETARTRGFAVSAGWRFR